MKMTSRDLLVAIGMGQHNATQAIPYLMIAPATTDPKTPMVINMVRLIQQVLYQLGATDVADTGYLDPPTARALRLVTGPNWERMPWASSITAVIGARDRGMLLSPASSGAAMAPAMPVAVSGPLDFLPDVPGGILTYAVAGYFLYRHFSKARSAR
jgi:hypothetical protein